MIWKKNAKCQNHKNIFAATVIHLNLYYLSVQQLVSTFKRVANNFTKNLQGNTHACVFWQLFTIFGTNDFAKFQKRNETHSCMHAPYGFRAS